MNRKPFEPAMRLPDALLPQGFVYPASYQTFVSSDRYAQILNGQPWTLFDVSIIDGLIARVRRENSKLSLVPFAIRQHTGHIVSFDGLSTDGEPRVVIVQLYEEDGSSGYIHPDYDVPGWLRNFDSWLSLVEADTQDFRRHQSAENAP